MYLTSAPHSPCTSLPPTIPHGLYIRGVYRQLPEESKLVNIPVQ